MSVRVRACDAVGQTVSLCLPFAFRDVITETPNFAGYLRQHKAKADYNHPHSQRQQLAHGSRSFLASIHLKPPHHCRNLIPRLLGVI
jgi:signal-transduction protein with cAMP-binding, CBS, and nucleotidyltransferase domain